MSAREEAIEQITREIAAEAVERAAGYMMSMCGNEGQMAIVESGLDNLLMQEDDIAHGDFDTITVGHPDAVAYILMVGDGICIEAAERCASLRREMVKITSNDASENFEEEDLEDY